MSVAAETIVRKFTRLGDAGSWQQGEFSAFVSYFDSNVIVSNLGAVLHFLFLGNRILINFGFQALAFYGLYRLMVSLESSQRKRLMLLLFLPSFTIWTSVASKEAVLVFAVSILCAYFVDIYNNREKLGLLHLFCVYLIFAIKTHYLVPLLFVFIVSKVSTYVRQSTIVVLLAGFISIFILYLFRDTIDYLSFEIIPHFVGFGRSTREIFWIEQYDVFWKAPYGMYQGFFGPPLIEAFAGKNILHIVSFIEGIILIGIFSYYVFYNFLKCPAYNFMLSIFAIFWMLFPNYPFGIMNPGSAIRYRSGYIVFIFFVFAVLMSRSLHNSWKKKNFFSYAPSSFKTSSRVSVGPPNTLMRKALNFSFRRR